VTSVGNTANDYDQFLARKLAVSPPTGLTTIPELTPLLNAFQRDLVIWALRRGRAALFADTGLGKTLMQILWADAIAKYTGGRVLILAPLSVSKQTEAEARKFGLIATRVHDGSGIGETGVYVTNYDRLHLFDASKFDGIVLDESSIIKNFAGKILAQLLESFRDTRYKLACSATPSPNDHTELGTHAEFLGVCTRTEMLAEFFCHDGADTSVWRLKGHARSAFWRWVSSWAAMLRRPSDLGYSDEGYVLPALHVHEHVSAADAQQTREAGLLFAEPVKGLMDRRKARRSTLNLRVQGCADLVQSDAEGWVIWCELNDEQEALRKLLGDQAVSITGSMPAIEKENLHDAWFRGEKRIIITKPSIFGWGLNWQHCARMAFVGVTDSFERYYQAVRREWRFGQKREVHVHLFYNEIEGRVRENLTRKEAEMIKMSEELGKETRDMVRSAVHGAERTRNLYADRAILMPAWMGRRVADVD
jgi:hypothetical protein